MVNSLKFIFSAFCLLIKNPSLSIKPNIFSLFTILSPKAIGVLVFAGFVDNFYSIGLNTVIGYSSYGFLSGTILMLVFAYTVRFQAVGYGSLRSGITQIPQNLVDASYIMGNPFNETMR